MVQSYEGFIHSSSAIISPLQDKSLSMLPPKVLGFLISCTSSHCPSIVVVDLSTFFRCLPRFLLPPMDVQTVSAALHLLSVLRLMWPAHVHFLFLIISIMSITLVWSLTHLLVFFRFYKWCWARFVPSYVVPQTISFPFLLLMSRSLFHMSLLEGYTGWRPFFLTMLVLYPS